MSTTPAPDPAGLAQPFRGEYLSYEALTEQLRAWADAYPQITRLRSLGQTPQGRELWLLQIGRALDSVAPAAWVDANMHASELAGSSVALAIAEDVLRLHLQPEQPLHELPEHLRQRLTELHFYILPRMSPDGAEQVLSTGRLLRSVPRDDRLGRGPHWRAHDLDGDGRALLMRKLDATGEFIESPDHPGLMLPRQLEDPGPYYKVWPEGSIEDFDGHTVPDPSMRSDNSPDLNRNFPYDWAPEHVQDGAGPHALSEPESRAVVEFAAAHPNIFTWLDLHTYGGVFIRPLGTAPDHTMDSVDLGVWNEVGRLCEPRTGYPLVSGYSDFTYEPDKPLRGDLTEYACHARGALAYVCELWDLFAQLDMPRPERFVDYYARFDRDTLRRLARWDSEHNAGRIFVPWRAFEHPQLGPVELGGMDIVVGIRNPPYERLAEICGLHASAYLRVAALAPRLWVGQPRVEAAADNLWTIELDVENRGYLGTYGVHATRDHDFNEPLRARVELHGGLRLLDVHDGARELGHLHGWGRGHDTTFGTPGFVRSRGSVSRRRLRWVVHGRGSLSIDVGSVRVGHQRRTVTVPDNA